jgi:hypothetical protein
LNAKACTLCGAARVQCGITIVIVSRHAWGARYDEYRSIYIYDGQVKVVHGDLDSCSDRRSAL